jgi:hypothetical protein
LGKRWKTKKVVAVILKKRKFCTGGPANFQKYKSWRNIQGPRPNPPGSAVTDDENRSTHAVHNPYLCDEKNRTALPGTRSLPPGRHLD